MVATRGRSGAYARLFPRRGCPWPPLLALSRRTLRRNREAAALVSARFICMNSNYAELIAASNFSFLRGASHPDEMVLTAKALGHAAIAIADRNSCAGLVRAHKAAKEVQIRFLPAVRLAFRDGFELTAYP